MRYGSASRAEASTWWKQIIAGARLDIGGRKEKRKWNFQRSSTTKWGAANPLSPLAPSVLSKARDQVANIHPLLPLLLFLPQTPLASAQEILSSCQYGARRWYMGSHSHEGYEVSYKEKYILISLPHRVIQQLTTIPDMSSRRPQI